MFYLPEVPGSHQLPPPPTTTVSATVFQAAETAHQAGQTLEAWKILAAAGDEYAKLAHHVLSREWSLLNCIRAAHWELTMPAAPMGGELWQTIAASAQAFYLETIKASRANQAAPTNYDLPNSRAIERTYMQAIQQQHLPLCSIIHLCANRLTTPLNTALESAVSKLTFGKWRPDLPNEWHEACSILIGRLDQTRQTDNSPNMNPESFWATGKLMTKAMANGTAHYLRGRLGLAPRSLSQPTTGLHA